MYRYESRWIPFLLSIGLAAEVSIGMWGSFSSLRRRPLPLGINICQPHVPDNLRYRMVCTYIGMVLYESALYILTLLKSLRVRQARRKYGAPRDSIVDLVIRDGTLYFISLLAPSVASIMLFQFANSDYDTLNVTFNHILPAVMTSRLCINLRGDIRRGSDQGTLWEFEGDLSPNDDGLLSPRDNAWTKDQGLPR